MIMLPAGTKYARSRLIAPPSSTAWYGLGALGFTKDVMCVSFPSFQLEQPKIVRLFSQHSKLPDTDHYPEVESFYLEQRSLMVQ